MLHLKDNSLHVVLGTQVSASLLGGAIHMESASSVKEINIDLTQPQKLTYAMKVAILRDFLAHPNFSKRLGKAP